MGTLINNHRNSRFGDIISSVKLKNKSNYITLAGTYQLNDYITRKINKQEYYILIETNFSKSINENDYAVKYYINNLRFEIYNNITTILNTMRDLREGDTFTIDCIIQKINGDPIFDSMYLYYGKGKKKDLKKVVLYEKENDKSPSVF